MNYLLNSLDNQETENQETENDTAELNIEETYNKWPDTPEIIDISSSDLFSNESTQNPWSQDEFHQLLLESVVLTESVEELDWMCDGQDEELAAFLDAFEKEVCDSKRIAKSSNF